MNKSKVLMTRSHLEAHDRGVKYILRKLVEGGFEVVYTPFREIKEIYEIAMEEDVDIIGLSCSATNSLYIVSALMEIFEKKQENFPVIIGGVVPNMDIPKLKEMGIKEVFGPGSDPDEIVEFFKNIMGNSPRN